MPSAGTWINLEFLILNEVSQREKDKYHMMSLYVESEIWLMKQKQTHTQRAELWSPRGRGPRQGACGLGLADATDSMLGG